MPSNLLRHLSATILIGLLGACDARGTPEEPPAPATTSGGEQCGDATGAWSDPVDGLRGRLVTSRDNGALRVTLELENVSEQPLEIHWTGRADAGFATFALDDPSGTEVPEPDWEFGGNEATGVLRVFLAPTSITRHQVPVGVHARPDGVFVVRVGAFWGREIPAADPRAYLRARVTGAPPSDEETFPVELSEEDGSALARVASPTDPRGRPWIGSLELPGVCVDYVAPREP